MQRKLKSKIRFRMSINIANLLIILVLSIGILFVVISTSMDTARKNAYKLFSEVGAVIEENLNGHMDCILDVAAFGSRVPSATSPVSGDGSSHPFLPFMRHALERKPLIYSLYLGYEDGNFLQLIAVNENPVILEKHGAPEGTGYILRSITNDGIGRMEYWTFYDSLWQRTGTGESRNAEYDPRVRDWYQAGQGRSGVQMSDAYVFHSLNQLGITGSEGLPGGGGVIGADMTLEYLSGFVNEERPSENGGILILDRDNRLLAATDGFDFNEGSSRAPLMEIPPWIEEGQLSGFSRNRQEWLGFRTDWEDGQGNRIKILVMSPFKDFTGYIERMQWSIIFYSLLLLFLVMAVTIIIMRGLTRILMSLADDAHRVKEFDFSGETPRDSSVLEFHLLSEGFQHMKSTIGERSLALQDSQDKLEKIIESGIAMAVEKDPDKLVEQILEAAKSIANADGGSVYLKGSDGFLEFKVVLNDTLGFRQGGTSGAPITIPHVPLFTPDGEPNHRNVVTHAFHTGSTVNIEDAYTYVESEFDFSGTKKFDAGNNYESHSFLTVPLHPLGGEVMGALQLINAKDRNDGTIIGFSKEIQRFVEALSASAATSLHNWELLETQKNLFDSMIQFTASAIDAKSHYTGGHCERVPHIALRLAEAANKTESGSCAEFCLKTPDEWREFQIAAWLHDCGKMTTPEFVVDKATRLETFHNRLHEIRTRFEVLLRDAEIEKLKTIGSGGDPEKAESTFSETISQLQDDYAFIADCNAGDRFVDQTDVERIRTIGSRIWIRNFDDRIGLSWAERDRFEGYPCQLPCEETLLSDKPEHIIKREKDLRDEYREAGFRMEIPEYLYNRGEIYNLSIPRGTLTHEERFKINEHVVQTIIMLNNLPLPETISRVPEYAGTHHETLTGSGYPRGLDASKLSIPSRIMAIADIFEALTASDRPYKETKTLSKCIRILHSFKERNHIDPELFDLFLSSGVYKQYALDFLKPEQIDEVDIAEFIG